MLTRSCVAPTARQVLTEAITAPGPRKTRIPFFKNLVNISKSSKCANCCSKGCFIAFPLQMSSGPCTGPSDTVTHWREESAIYTPQMFTFVKTLQRVLVGLSLAQQTLKTYCCDGWSLSPDLINRHRGPCFSLRAAVLLVGSRVAWLARLEN